MSDDDTWDLPQLPAPLGDGEPLVDYIRRAVIEDEQFLYAVRGCPTGYRPIVTARFCPANFTSQSVRDLHEGVALVRLRDADRLQRMLDHLWLASRGRHLPLYIRMAKEPQLQLGNIVGNKEPFIEPPGFPSWRAAAKRRDILVAALCEGLRQGQFRCTGISPQDIARAPTDIVPDWWSDPAFCVDPRKGENVVDPQSPLPHLRGIMLRGVRAAAGEDCPKDKGMLPPSSAALRKWWIEVYVPEQKAAGISPSREDDLAAAADAFRDKRPPSRNDIRDLRKLPETPADWKRAGRPRNLAK